MKNLEVNLNEIPKVNLEDFKKGIYYIEDQPNRKSYPKGMYVIRLEDFSFRRIKGSNKVVVEVGDEVTKEDLFYFQNKDESRILLGREPFSCEVEDLWKERYFYEGASRKSF